LFSLKVAIIELYLQKYTYSQISRTTRYSPFAIKRYLTTFARVINLTERRSPHEIAFLLGISPHVSEECFRPYQRYNLPQYRDRIEDISSLSSFPGVGFKKGGIL